MTDFIENGLEDSSEKEDLAHEQAMTEYRAERDALIARLEKKLEKKRLKFTVPFTGNIPNTALGDYKGMRFYFRFRGDCASLEVGKVDVKKYESEYMNALFNWALSDGSDPEWKEMLKPRPPIMEGTHVYPNVILFASYKDNVTGDPYSSTLTPEEAEDLFLELVANLKKV